MDTPEVRYARSGDVSIAYQVFGEGDVDLVIAHGFFSHIEVDWEWPPFARFLKRLGSFARVVLFDKRGTGLSDPMEGAPTLEERVDDIRAVMDAAGSERAALFGYSEGGPMCAMFAASHPERVTALILYGTFARIAHAPDYEIGMPQGLLDGFIDELREHWPVPPEAMVRMIFPGAEDDPGFIEWMLRRSRFGASPKMAVSVMRLNTQLDIRSILPDVRVPTLVLHREGDAFVLPAWGRYLAERVPGARYVELEGADHSPFRGDLDAIVDEVEEFLTGTRGVHEVDRALATVLFTDIVGSTERAAVEGDAGWGALLDRHDVLVSAAVERHRGRVVKTTGDGALAIFDGPARAIRCAKELVRGLGGIGIDIRAGLHTGECELRNGDVGGMAVHIGARVSALAGPGEVLASGTVKDLVIGSGLGFTDRGEHDLKGVPGPWRLYAVEHA